MAAGQDWCMECGAGAPGSLGTPGWRSAATILAVVAVLVLGAAAAAFAALSKGAGKAPVVTKTVALASVPTATTPAGTTPGTTGALGTAPSTKATLPLGTVKPPKIPLTAVTPKASEKASTTTTTPAAETKTSTSTNTTTTSTTPSEKTNEESQQSAILLDTNAASTYNPYGYPASGFGDPSLAIDGDTSTAWIAQVIAASAPKMAQVYGANGHTAPSTITASAWTPLSPPEVAKKKHLRITLRDSSKAFTFISLWISKAPESSTPENPGHVDVNELELFPPK
jgi:hypothetical protein